jgi:hypothetical protein
MERYIMIFFRKYRRAAEFNTEEEGVCWFYI